jgi:hypothetical protein
MNALLRNALLALAFTFAGTTGLSAQTPTPAPTPAPTPMAAQKATPGKPKGFPTAEAAADALTDAVRKNDDKAIAVILGAGWREFVPPPEDEDRVRADFLKAWDESHKLVPTDDTHMLVSAGTNGWVGPIPIVKDGNEWHYDIEAGRKELIAREIGRNELSVIQTLLAIVDAEREYASLDPMKLGVPNYARRLMSSPGKRDGLYWETQPGEPESPLGPLVAKAQLGGQQRNGYYGYHFRLLYRQGPDAKPGGAHEFVVNGKMIAGFGVIAWPLKYGETGVMTFMVNQHGDVYEQDLGPDTVAKAGAISSFNPDKDWSKADMTP